MLQYYLQTTLPENFKLSFIASHKDGSKPYKLYVALKGLLRMCALMLQGGIEIVHIHCGDIRSHHRKYIFFRTAQIFKKKIILHLHGAQFIEQFKKTSPFWKCRIAAFFEKSQVVICLSRTWSRDIEVLFPRSKRMVIPNGIPLPQRNSSPRNSDRRVILTFLGLVGPRKGVFDLLEAVKRLSDNGLPIFLKIGGNGEIKKLNCVINELDLQDYVEYIGWVTGKKKEQLFEETDIFVLPSYGEGMPMAILEAMSYSIPVVSTLVGGIPELVRNYESGFLIHPGDIEELYGKLKCLVEGSDLRKRMGKNARATVECSFSIEANVNRVSDLYMGLLSEKGRPSSV